MSKVHLFPEITEVFDDTKLPLQSLGDGQDPEASQVRLDVLGDFFAVYLGIGTTAQTVSDGDSIAVAGGNLIMCIAIEAPTGARTVKIGTTAGGEDIMEESGVPDGVDLTHTFMKYTSTPLTLHFTITGGTCSVLVFTKPKS
jgi:hypothetical protein